MGQITDIVAQYAEGQVEMQETLNQIRQLTPVQREASPYVDELMDDEGTGIELASACIIYDCTKDEYGLFVQAFAGTPIGPQESTATPEFDESEKPTLMELLGEGSQDDPDDVIESGLVVAPVAVDPTEDVPTEEPTEDVPVEKHTPGGVSHDQDLHGSWSSGSAPDTSSSGGAGATITQGGDGSGSPPAAGSPPATSPVTPDAQRPGGRVERPKNLADLSGQSRVRERLSIMVDAARQGGRRLDHIMFSGPPGLGKTTMAKALANEMGANIKVVTGPALKDREALQNVLKGMEDGDILFIDEIHALPQKVDEMLFPIMEDGEMDIHVEGRGTFRVKTPDITFLGATTNPEGVVKPLRDRFGANEKLSFYKDAELAEIVQATAAKKGMTIDSDVANMLAARSRGTPRIANRLVRRVNDYIGARGGELNTATANKVLNLWDIDARGLTSEDRRVMGSLKDLGTAGINTMSAATGLDESTISSVVEPYLLRQGLINRTPKGRTLTQAGLVHLDTYGRDDLGDFEVSKRLGGRLATFSAPIEIAKADERQNLVFGWANVTFDKGNQVVDHQGHMIDVEELESAAYNFAVKYRKTGDNHKGEGFGELVESLIVTEEKIAKGGFPEEMLGKWWIGFRVPPEDWDKVERGERSMFSIQGRAQLEAM